MDGYVHQNSPKYYSIKQNILLLFKHNLSFYDIILIMKIMGDPIHIIRFSQSDNP